MKTVIIFDQVLEEPLKFLVVEGDRSHLDQKYLNSMDTSEEECDEINSLIFKEDWSYVDGFVDTFPTQSVVEGAKVVVVGFIP